jgi:ABC-2 type transport system permease protein
MFSTLKRVNERYRYSRILLRQLVITEFKLRYQGSVLGYLWSLLKPLAIFTILYIVFVKFLKIGAGIPYPAVYLLLGIVVWNFFIEVTAGSIGAIVGRGDLIRKINFPKYILIIASLVSALINFIINLGVVFVFSILNNVQFSLSALLAIPLIIELFLLCLGIAFFLSAAYVKFRDINFIWEVVLQGLFFATPIIYILQAPIPLSAQKLLILSPVAQIVQDLRYVLITPETRTFEAIYGSSVFRLIPLSFVFVLFFVASLYFRHSSKNFAENV